MSRSTSSLARTAILTALGAFMFSGRASADGPTISVETEYLGTLELQVDPPQVVGSRYIVNLPGGTMLGPKINGAIVAPAGDWLIPMPDGSLRLDARETIKTNDGEYILVENHGVIVASKDVNDRFSKGEVITAKDEYFVVAPRFSTASKNYDWLNKIQAVGKMVTLSQKSVKFDLFVVR
jgi:Protein of unknown function (DUF3237)